MALATVVSYDPTLKTVTVVGDILTSQLTSIVNLTRGKDLFVVGQTPVTARVYNSGNTTFTFDTDTTGDNANDVLAVRYQSNSNGGLTNAELRASAVEISPSANSVFYSSLPKVTSGTIMSLTTSATGSNYVAFGSQVCTALDLVNNTGTTIEYRRGATGVAMQLPDKSSRMIIGISNANQIDVRRTDTSNTQVTVQAEAFVL